jgi:hypothetical protein
LLFSCDFYRFSQIRAGWTLNSNDYTTKCPSCGERFVARFSIVSSKWAADKAAYASHGGVAIAKRPTTPPLSPDSVALYKTSMIYASLAEEQEAQRIEAERAKSVCNHSTVVEEGDE